MDADRFRIDAPQGFRHPHDSFREGLSLFYSASVRNTGDTGRLLGALWAYVEGMLEGGPHHDEFSRDWDDLQDRWESNGSHTGAGGMMSDPEYESQALVIIVKFAKRAGIFDPPDASFGRRELARQLDKFRG